MPIRFTWSEPKRRSNLRKHGIDFRDAERVFMGRTVQYEDSRFDYGETRFVTLGLLGFQPVTLVHTQTHEEIRIVSFRKAQRREAAYYFETVFDGLAPDPGAEG